jgi:hypothetical protein
MIRWKYGKNDALPCNFIILEKSDFVKGFESDSAGHPEAQNCISSRWRLYEGQSIDITSFLFGLLTSQAA